MNEPLRELLEYLAYREPSDFYNDADGTGDSYMFALLEAWQSAGHPGIEQGVPVPDGYDGLCMIEVNPAYRPSRGRFWLPKGHGYTNDPKQAGLFTVKEARDSDRTRAILPVSS